MKKANNKKCIAVLSSAALGVLIASALTTTDAHAAVKSYVAKDASDASKVISFDSNALLADYTNNVLGKSSPMFDQYLKDAGNLVAFQDTVKGYVSAESVEDAYAKALASGNGKDFNIDTVTENAADADLAKDLTVGYTANTDGTLTAVDNSKSITSVSAITATTNTGAAPTLPSTVNVTLADGTTKAANITWDASATAAATYANAGTVTVNGTLADYDNYKVSATVTVNGALTVQSVSAVNANEIKVVFNQEVNKDTAENAGNYTINVNGLSYAPSGLTAKLLSDNKTVILSNLTGTAENRILANGDNYQVVVDKVVNTSYQAVTKYDTGIQVFNDTTAPSLLNAKYDGANIVLYFSEPVDATSIAYKIDNGALSAARTLTSTAEDNSNGEYKVKITPTNDEKTVGNHSITVYSVNDKASVPNILTVATTPYAVSADTTAPSVVNLTPYTQDKFKVKVSESLNVSAANFKNLLTVKKGNYTIAPADITSALDPTDSTNTTYIVTVTPSDTVNNPLYATGETSAALSVKVSGYTDNAGLVGADYNNTVTLTKSTVGPTLANAALNTGSGSTITLKFNDTISATTDYTKITVLKDGVAVPVSSAILTGANNDELAVGLSSPLTAGNYTIQLGAGAVQDVYGVKNVSTLATAYTYTAAAITFNSAFVVAATSPSGVKNAIDINYGTSEVMDDSAVVLSNYKLDGAAFPAGTTISFYGDKQHVRITLPDNYFSANTSGQVGITKNVKDVNGKYIVTVSGSGIESEYVTTTPVSFTDNVKPTLSSAKYLLNSSTDTTTNKIDLTFSENLGSVADNANSRNDFKVLVNGVKQTVADVIDGTANDKDVTLTLASPVNISQASTISIVPEANQDDATASNNVISITDAAGNKAVEGSSATAAATQTDTNSASAVEAQVAINSIVGGSSIATTTVNSTTGVATVTINPSETGTLSSIGAVSATNLANAINNGAQSITLGATSYDLKTTSVTALKTAVAQAVTAGVSSDFDNLTVAQLKSYAGLKVTVNGVAHAVTIQ